MWTSGRQITLLRQGPDGKLGPRDAGKRARLKAGLLPSGKLWTWYTAVIREAAAQWQSQARMARMSVQGHFQLKAVMNPATDKHMLTTMLAIDYLNSSNPTPTVILEEKTFSSLRYNPDYPEVTAVGFHRE